MYITKLEDCLEEPTIRQQLLSGLCPCDRNVFRLHEFISDSENANQIHNSSTIQIPVCDSSHWNRMSRNHAAACPTALVTAFLCYPQISVLCLSLQQGIKPTKGRKAGGAALLTSSPYEDNLANELIKMKKVTGLGMKETEGS
nr:unnamed protein product [Callosobruchus analis]